MTTFTLQAELRGLKFQIAAIQGSSSPNKITFLGSEIPAKLDLGDRKAPK